MSTRTRKGSLTIRDYTGEDREVTVIPGAASVVFLVVDKAADQRIEIYLGAAELDELEAEIQRLRAERGI